MSLINRHGQLSNQTVVRHKLISTRMSIWNAIPTFAGTNEKNNFIHCVCTISPKRPVWKLSNMPLFGTDISSEIKDIIKKRLKKTVQRMTIITKS